MGPERSEYQQLQQDFVWHAHAVGWIPTTQDERDMATFLLGMERFDEHLDAIADAEERCDFSRRLLARLAGDLAVPLPERVEGPIDRLTRVLRRRRTAAGFVARAARGLEVTESLRHVRHLPRYLRLVVEEGRVTTDLAMMAVAPVPGGFRHVFMALGPVGNFVDEFLDLRADHEAGVRTIGRGPCMRMIVGFSCAWWAMPALARHPRRVRLLGRGAAYLFKRS